jgi:hypothetical protein
MGRRTSGSGCCSPMAATRGAQIRRRAGSGGWRRRPSLAAVGGDSGEVWSLKLVLLLGGKDRWSRIIGAAGGRAGMWDGRGIRGKEDGDKSTATATGLPAVSGLPRSGRAGPGCVVRQRFL